MSRPRSTHIPGLGAALAAGLVVLTWAAFSGVLHNSFVNYDDDVYVTGNAHVLDGLDGKSVSWAFTTFDAANWHPITWLSHMLDVQVFGLDAGRHHLVSLLLHAANAVLLFLVLLRMTGAHWRSAFVAGLFAVHPLHVESVAWIAERKDLLSTLFWLLTVAAWLRFVPSKTAAAYALVLALFALGLMAKPMLVTLPLTLMLMDVWPLKRAMRPTLWQEKVPLFAMSAASAIITFVAQRSGGAMRSLSGLAFFARAGNAAESYVWYLAKTVWPTSLACFYPHPGTIRLGPAIGASLLIVGVTALAARLRNRAPYLAFGWAWYLVTLVPVIGLVQVGAQAAADRYTYVPLVGPFVAVAWGLAELVEAHPPVRLAVAGLCAACVAALVPVTRTSVGYWHDNVSLFTRALAVTSNNGLAHNNLGLALAGQGLTDQAIAHYREALWIHPDYVEARSNLGAALHQLGRDAEAAEELKAALAIDPKSVEAQVNLGNAMAGIGRPDEAIERYREALRLRPGNAEAQRNLGVMLDRIGRHDEAILELERAVRLRPGDPSARLGYGNALAAAGRTDEALAQMDAALRLQPDFPAALNALGIVLAEHGRTAEAIERYEQALRAKPDYAEAANNLGLALAALNRLPEAIDRFQQAVRINPGFAQAHNNLGVSLARANRVPEALGHFREAVRIDPGLDQARTNLGKLEETRH